MKNYVFPHMTSSIDLKHTELCFAVGKESQLSKGPLLIICVFYNYLEILEDT